MGQAIGEMLTMAVAVAVSPIPIIAVVLLLANPGGRVNGTAFVAGCCASTAIVGGALVAMGIGSGSSSDGGPSTAASLLRVLLGIVLIGLAAKNWRGRPLEGEEAAPPRWMGALVELLERLQTWLARNSGVIMGVVLLLIGVKILGDGISGL